MESEPKTSCKTYHDHSHPNRSQLRERVRACEYQPKCSHRTTKTYHRAPMLPSPKHEPLPPRGHPRTLEALRQHVHRKFPTPVLCLNKHRHSGEQAAQPERRLGDERGEQPWGDARPPNQRTMRVLSRAEVSLPPVSCISHKVRFAENPPHLEIW
jgi:hypothetical protein